MKHSTTHLLASAALMLTSLTASAQELETPTMGWSSWNTYGFQISESIIKSQAKAMVDRGLNEVGYSYVNIDDGYFGGRDKSGHLLIHPTRFPNGMKPVVDYIHGLGLKAGIYSDGGHNTCASYHGGDKIGEGVGLYEHDQIDCDFFFKDLDFDFIKVDFCGGVDYHNNEGLNLDEKKRYTEIHNAIVKAGKQGVRMNVCRWAYPGTWVNDVATSWRTTGDINCSWESVKGILAENLYMSAYCRDGHYNDMDMLEVGRGLTSEEDKTHFAMWCIMSSPLLIGCDMKNISEQTLSLLKNTDLIAANQDKLGLQAYVAKYIDGCYILVKDVETLQGNTRVFVVYNPTDSNKKIDVNFSDIDLAGKVQVRNLMTQSDLGVYEDVISARVLSHGVKIYKVTAERRLERKLYEAETAYVPSYQEIKYAQTAQYVASDANSGGYRAEWLGNGKNNGLHFLDVYSQTGGDYYLNIAYMSGESRNITVEVNGVTAYTFRSLNSGGWGTIKTAKTKIKLDKGNNKIVLYTASGWMPNVDYMSLDLITPLPDAVEAVEAEDGQSDKASYNLAGQPVGKGYKGIVVKNKKKVLK